MKTPIQLLSEHTGIAEKTLNIYGAMMPIQGVLEFAQKLIEQSEQNKMLLMAKHQLTGYGHASQGYSIIDLVRYMSLTQEEWNELKSKSDTAFLRYCDFNEVEEYFKEKADENS